MSADNWSICPQCLSNYLKKTEEMRKNLETSYGKVPADQFILMSQVVDKRDYIDIEDALGRTLREDYEVLVDDTGKFYISYRCECNRCDFKYVYKYEEKVKIK